MRNVTPCCPSCGRKMPAPKPAPAVSGPIDTSQMSDREVFAYYKKTSHIEDVRFMLAHAEPMPAALYAIVSDLLRRAPSMPRADVLREHAYNLALWRIAVNQRDIDTCKAAGGWYDREALQWVTPVAPDGLTGESEAA